VKHDYYLILKISHLTVLVLLLVQGNVFDEYDDENGGDDDDDSFLSCLVISSQRLNVFVYWVF